MGLVWKARNQLLVLTGPDDHPRVVDLTIDDAGRVTATREIALEEPTVEPIATNGVDLAYGRLDTSASVVIADLGARGLASALRPAAPASLQLKALGGWLPDGRLLVSRFDRAADAADLEVLAIDGTLAVIEREEPGKVAYALTVDGEDLVYWRGDRSWTRGELWLAKATGEKHRIADGDGPVEVRCAAHRCVVGPGDEDTGVRLLDLDKGTYGPPLLPKTGRSDVAVAISPDGKTIAAGRGNKIVLYDLQTHKTTTRTAPGLDYVQSIAFDGPDLIITDNSFAPGTHALLELHPDDTVDVLAADGAWYYAPAVDLGRKRLAVSKRAYANSLHVAPLSNY